jgi:hypothetical protein
VERHGKYNARPIVEAGIRFDSQAEARRYGELRLLEAAGQIKSLVPHPKYPLTVNGERVGTYVGDASYLENGEVVIEDVKSPPTKTPIYRLKAKLVHALYGITIREVSA